MSLLPSSPDVTPDGEPRVVGLDSEEADDLIAALSSGTARRLLAELHEEPAPPAALADRADTSLQNAQYHLEKLEAAGAVEVVGTAYSEKGREMRVYGPADQPLVIFAGDESGVSGLRAALSRLLGGFAALAFGGLVVQELFGESLLQGAEDAAGPTGDDAAAPTETPAPSPTPVDEQEDAGGFTADTGTPTDAAAGAADGDGTPEPTPEATGQETSTPQPEAPPAEDDDAADAPPETETPEATAAPDGGDDASSTAAHETPTEVAEHTETVTDTVAATPEAFDGGIELLEPLLASGLPPGAAFFLGGATVLVASMALSYYQARP